MSVPDKEKVTISDHLFRSQTLDGCYGVEVEVEGENLPIDGLSKYWNVTRDGSLRGESYEYVFLKPLNREDTSAAISMLYKKLSKAKWVDSGRAGVHVHMNVRDLSIQETVSFILLYLVFEEVLLDFCGEDRKGNLFCLRSDDAEYFLIKLREFLENFTFGAISTDAIRYSSINLTALKKYGSLEFRSLPSPVSEEKLNLWINLLTAIRSKAVSFADPRLIVTGVSEYGGEDFARSVLEDLFPQLPCDNWNRTIIRGMRKIQPLVESISLHHLTKLEEYTIGQKKARSSENKYAFGDIEVALQRQRLNTDWAEMPRVEIRIPRVPDPVPAIRQATVATPNNITDRWDDYDHTEWPVFGAFALGEE